MKLKKKLSLLKPFFKLEYIRDICLLAGFLMFARGLWLIYHPVMWLVCGGIIIWVGIPGRSANYGAPNSTRSKKSS